MINMITEVFLYAFLFIGCAFVVIASQMMFRLMKNSITNSLVFLHIAGSGGFGVMLILIGISFIENLFISCLCYILFIIMIIVLPISSSLLAYSQYKSDNF